MDHSVCNLKAILAVAVLAMAAFAGVMIVGDDADAADEVTYKVTYVYGDNVRASTSGATIAKLMAFDEAFGVECPEGYTFDKWKIGSSLYAEEATDVEIAGDVTVEPTFKVKEDKAVVIIVDGDKSEKIVLEATIPEGESDPVASGISKDQITAALTALGVKFSITDDTKVVSIEKTGFKFEGFQIKESGAGMYSYDVDDLTGTAGKEVVYKMVYTPIYNISFVVEGASVLEITSDKVVLNTNADRPGNRPIPVAPSKDNYLFMGWYNAVGEKIIGYSSDKNEYTYSVKDFKFTENTTLYAKFVPVTFTVTFVYGEDRAVFATETVKYGDLAIEPKGLPEGYKGWDWNFGVPIEADTEIPAIEADPVTVYTVTFEIDGKAPVTQRSDSMVLPDTAIEGKVFQGWVVKGESQYVNPMSYDITGDITFVAVYKEADPPAGPGFFQTTEGKCVGVLIAVVIIAFIYAVYTNMFGLKDVLTSVKITRVKK